VAGENRPRQRLGGCGKAALVGLSELMRRLEGNA